MSSLGRALKNATALTLAELLSKALNFVFIAILVRQLTPADFGGYTTIMSLIWLLGPLADLGISQILVREVAANRSRAGTLFFNAVLVTGGLATVASGLLVVIAGVAHYPEALRPLIAISGLAVIGNTLTQTAGSLMRGFERMEVQALVASGLLLCASLFGIVLALAGWGLAIQVIINLSVSLAGAGLMLLTVHRRFVPVRWVFDAPLCRSLLRQALPVAVLIAYSVLLRWSDTLILGQVRSLGEVAIYGAAQKIIDLVMVFSTSASAALFPMLSSRWQESLAATYTLYQRSLRFFAALGLTVSVGLVVLAKPLAILLLGKTYELAGPPLQWLAVAFFFQVVSGPMGMLLIATGDRLGKFVPAIGLVVVGNIVLNLLLAPRWGYMGAAGVFLLTSLATFLVRQWAAYDYFEHPPRLGELLWRPGLAALAMGIGMWIVRSWGLPASLVVGGILFLVVMAGVGELKQEPYLGLLKLLRATTLDRASHKARRQ
jgi:O-antigen/teichoic acid export membrane protein